MAPSVLHLPAAELAEFNRVIVQRLSRQLRTRIGPALAFALKHQEAPLIPDSEHIRQMSETLFSRFMTTDLDAQDRTVLGPLAERPGTVYKLDVRASSMLTPIEGVYTTGSVVYLHRAQPQERCTPLGVAFWYDDAPLLIQPGDGDAWELAKHYAVMGASYLGLLGTHTLVHFPTDSVNAISKAVLPPEHTLFKLLAPHLYIQLCLDFSVQHIDKSPYHNNQTEFFTGLAYDGPTSPWRITRAVYAGVPGNPTFPGYRFPRAVEPTHSDYGDFLLGYYQVFRTFVAEVLADVSTDDPLVARWAAACGQYVRGFPTLEELADHAVLVDTVTYVIWNASVLHSTDHYSWGTIPILERSLRLRVPPPRSRTITLDRRAMTTAEDRFRLCLTDQMSLTPTPFVETRLMDVDYGFAQPALQKAQQRFHAGLRAYDAAPGVTRHIPLADIACSIQY